MTLLTFQLNGTDGTVLASGDAATIGASTITTSGGTVSLASGDAVHGSTGLRIAGTSGGAARAIFAFNASNNSVQVTVEVRTPPTAPTATVDLFSLRYGTSPTTGGSPFRVAMGTTGNIVAFDNGSAHNGTILAGASFNTKYRISLVITGGSTTAGAVTAKVYASGGSTALGTLNVTNWDLTANQLAYVNLGATSWGATTNVGYDDLQMNDGAGSEIPAYTPVNLPPTVSVTGNQNKATGETATIAVTASDPDGTIAARSLTFEFPTSGTPTVTGAGTASPSFPVGSTEGVLYELLETVTDDGGLSASARTEVRVPVTTNADIRPLAKDAGKTGTFNRVGGSATDGAALADGSNTTYLESGSVSSTGQVMRIRLAPRTALGSGAQIGVTLQSDSGTTNWQIRLYTGGTSTPGSGTLRKSWTQSAVGTSWNEYLLTIDDTSLATISDWGGLFLEAEVTG